MMKIVEFQSAPCREFRYLNAGRSLGSFFEASVPVHLARVNDLP